MDIITAEEAIELEHLKHITPEKFVDVFKDEIIAISNKIRRAARAGYSGVQLYVTKPITAEARNFLKQYFRDRGFQVFQDTRISKLDSSGFSGNHGISYLSLIIRWG